GRVGNTIAACGQALVGHDADVVAGRFEQIAKRNQQATRQQQHVEEQRADDCDAGDCQRSTNRIARNRAPGEPPGRHRRMSVPTSRRSNVHEATRPAAMPSGTANAIDLNAIGAVTRTNTSAVSYRHWKYRLTRPCASSATRMPNSAPAHAITNPSSSTSSRMN